MKWTGFGDRFLVQAGIKFNFSEFILIFDLEYGNTILLTFDIFMKDCSIGTILSRKQQSNSSTCMENSLFENISGEGGE